MPCLAAAVAAVGSWSRPAAPVAAAYRVSGFPAWCVLDADGVVRHSGMGIDRLPIPVAP